MQPPSQNGSNGRTSGGRFAKGNAGGPGNPFAKRAGALRSALYDAVSEDDLRAVIEKMVEAAKDGDMPAARELLNRLLGKPEPTDILERLETIEQRMAEQPS